MVENDLRVLFGLEADGEQPPTRISIPAAGRRARIRQRRRRLVAIASPVLAAAAVIGVVASGALVGADHGSGPAPGSAPGSAGAGSPTPSPSQVSLPLATGSSLNPLTVYATFGWLPAGLHIGNVGTGRAWMFVNAGAAWALGVYAPGQCQRRPSPAKPASSELTCTGGIVGNGTPASVISRAPDVQRHRAYWVSADAAPALAWQYAPGSWAVLLYPAKTPSRHTPQKFPKSALAVKVADHTIIGTATPILFPAQLTGVPASWQVSSTDSGPIDGVLAAGPYQVTAGPVVIPPAAGSSVTYGTPVISVTPLRPVNVNFPNTCSAPSGSHSDRKVINGYQVTIFTVTSGLHEQLLCAAKADGLFVSIYASGKPLMSLASIFAHLHLLGPNPADWTTKPIG